MGIKWSKIIFSALFLTFIVVLTCTPVFATQPSCPNANAIINPGNQSVPEATVVNGIRTATTVTLDGTNSNPKGGVTCSWSQTAGTPQVTINDPSSCYTTFTAPEVGTSGASLTFQLMVTETEAGCTNKTDSRTTTINVTNVNSNSAPIVSAKASPETVNEGGLVSLIGSASDPDGDSLTYVWSQIGSGPTATLIDSTSLTSTFLAPEVPYPDGATLTFRLTVSDGSLSSSTDKIVNVTWVNDPPVASIASCPISVDEGAVVTLDGSASSDGDGDGIASYTWSQLSGWPNADLSGVVLTAPTITFTAPQLISHYNTMSFGLIVKDNGGLSNSAECSVIVNDVTPPTINVADKTAEATSGSGAVVSFNPTAHDLVDGDVDVTCDPISNSVFSMGTTTVSCSAHDTAGNTASASFTVTVQDTTPPSLTLPTPITKEATGPSGATVTFSVTANDLVDGPVTPSCSPTSGSTFALGTTSVTCSATDAHGNTASGSFNVDVVDTTPPALTLPTNMTAEATGPSGAAVTFAASATDIVDGSVTVTCIPASGSIFSLGTTTVNCSATDAHFNTGSGSFTVTVVDTTPPSLKLPSNITTEASSLSGAVVTFTASADDLVDGSVTPVCTPASGSIFAPGPTTVNCSATDSHGNKASGSFIVTVTFRLSGFYSPIDMNGVTNTVKGGSTVPMKFEVFAGSTELTSTFAISSITAKLINCTSLASAEDAIEAVATGGTSLRYDSTGGQFIFNWQTPKSAGACFVVIMTTLDGSHISANFKLK